jgi:hypothetical protein
LPILAINMNQPGAFVHWSIFDITVANLVLIGVMVVIFGAALLLPFPRGQREDAAAVTHSTTGGAADAADGDPVDPATARMWTYRLRTLGLKTLPPHPLIRIATPAFGQVSLGYPADAQT